MYHPYDSGACLLLQIGYYSQFWNSLRFKVNLPVFLIDISFQVVKYILGYTLWSLKLPSCSISFIRENNKLERRVLDINLISLQLIMITDELFPLIAPWHKQMPHVYLFLLLTWQIWFSPKTFSCFSSWAKSFCIYLYLLL